MSKKPTITLRGEAELREFLANPVWKDGDNGWKTDSDFIRAVIDETAQSGVFPYNSTVQCEVERRLGVPCQDDSGSVLSCLVYNAQEFRDEARLEAEGWMPMTQEVVDEAFRIGGKIELRGDFIRQIFNVRKINGKCYAMKPKARNKALAVAPYHSVRIVEKGDPNDDRPLCLAVQPSRA